MLSSHSFTRTAASWLHEKSMHECLSGGPGTLEVFQGPGSTSSTMTSIKPSANILPGTLGSLKSTGVGDIYWIPPVVNFPGVDSVLADSRGICLPSKQPLPKTTRALKRESRRYGRNFPWRFELAVLGTVVAEEDAKSYRGKYSNRLESFTLGSTTSVRVWGDVLRR